MTDPTQPLEVDEENLTVCPDCGFTWDNGHLQKLLLSGGNFLAELEKWRNHAVNAKPAEEAVPEGMTRLGRLMMNEAGTIEADIVEHGPAFVANWFFQVAGSIAAQYNLTQGDNDTEPFVAPQEG